MHFMGDREGVLAHVLLIKGELLRASTALRTAARVSTSAISAI
jgi:hypothetical protein